MRKCKPAQARWVREDTAVDFNQEHYLLAKPLGDCSLRRDISSCWNGALTTVPCLKLQVEARHSGSGHKSIHLPHVP